MPLYKFKSFEEAEQALWNFKPDPEYYRQVSQLFDLAFRLAPPRNTPGILKYKSINEAGRDRIIKK